MRCDGRHSRLLEPAQAADRATPASESRPVTRQERPPEGRVQPDTAGSGVEPRLPQFLVPRRRRFQRVIKRLDFRAHDRLMVGSTCREVPAFRLGQLLLGGNRCSESLGFFLF